MLCTHCGINPASATVKQTINGQTTVQYLCSECTGKFQLGFFNHPLFSTSSLFSGLFGQDEFEAGQSESHCSKCGATLRQIMSTGHLGCAGCASVFKNDLSPTIRKIHGNAAHTGKVPQTASAAIKARRQLEVLELQLQEAVAKQDFEQAASLRDEINRLKG